LEVGWQWIGRTRRYSGIEGRGIAERSFSLPVLNQGSPEESVISFAELGRGETDLEVTPELDLILVAFEIGKERFFNRLLI